MPQLGAGLLVYVLALAALPFLLAPSTFGWLVSENGFFECASILMWLIAASAPLVHTRYHPVKGPAYSLMFLLFAAREADLHKAFTSDSFLKTAFYKGSWGTEQVFGALAAIFIIALIGTIMVQTAVYLFRRGGLRHTAGQVLMLSWGMLIFSKFIDRLPAYMHKFTGSLMPPLQKRVLLAWEEGLEMAVPVLFMLALLLTPNLIRQGLAPRSRPAGQGVT